MTRGTADAAVTHRDHVAVLSQAIDDARIPAVQIRPPEVSQDNQRDTAWVPNSRYANFAPDAGILSVGEFPLRVLRCSDIFISPVGSFTAYPSTLNYEQTQ